MNGREDIDVQFNSIEMELQESYTGKDESVKSSQHGMTEIDLSVDTVNSFVEEKME